MLVPPSVSEPLPLLTSAPPEMDALMVADAASTQTTLPLGQRAIAPPPSV